MEVYWLTLPLPPSLPVTFLHCVWVGVHGTACKEYYDYILFLRIYVFVDLVKRSVLTLLGEISAIEMTVVVIISTALPSHST